MWGSIVLISHQQIVQIFGPRLIGFEQTVVEEGLLVVATFRSHGGYLSQACFGDLWFLQSAGDEISLFFR